MSAFMAEGRQLVLDLGHRAAFGRDDFLVAPGNSDAVDWIDRWPAWPGHALAIFGPPGCGKSHLVHVFALRAQARVIAPAEVTTAKPLSDAQRATVTASLKQAVGRAVTVTETVDPAILGGLIVKVGSRMVDGSLKSKLQRLERAMKGNG
ncbi:MAG: ATP synthase F1 subunit delta [Rhodospirillaceae bacterium]|nr:ATP synthase F1 subunit delta [Rhodospirillaceae bacterium]